MLAPCRPEMSCMPPRLQFVKKESLATCSRALASDFASVPLASRVASERPRESLGGTAKSLCFASFLRVDAAAVAVAACD